MNNILKKKKKLFEWMKLLDKKAVTAKEGREIIATHIVLIFKDFIFSF